MSLKKLAHTAGRTTAFKNLGLVKTALTAAEVRALTGGSLDGIARAMSHKYHRARNALIGAAGGSLLGLGGAELGLRVAPTAERAVARGIGAAPAAEQAVARGIGAAPTAERAVARGMEAAPAAEQAVVGEMPNRSRITHGEMPTGTARRVDIQNLPDLHLGYGAETDKHINEEYKRLVEPIAQFHANSNTELHEAYESIPAKYKARHPLHSWTDRGEELLSVSDHADLERKLLGQGPYTVRHHPSSLGTSSLESAELLGHASMNVNYSPLRAYVSDRYDLHRSALKDAIRKVVGGVKVTGSDKIIHAINNPEYWGFNMRCAMGILLHGLEEVDPRFKRLSPEVVEAARRMVAADVTHPLFESAAAEAANHAANEAFQVPDIMKMELNPGYDVLGNVIERRRG